MTQIETDVIMNAYRIQRVIGRRLQLEWQRVADEELPDDMADLLFDIDRKGGPQPTATYRAQ